MLARASGGASVDTRGGLSFVEVCRVERTGRRRRHVQRAGRVGRVRGLLLEHPTRSVENCSANGAGQLWAGFEGMWVLLLILGRIAL